MKKGWKLSIQRIMTSSLRTIYPSFLVKKFGAVLSVGQMDEIWEKWDRFIKTGAKPSRKKNMGRGKTPAFHFGVWRRYQEIPFITKDSRNVASDPLLNVIRKSVAGKIATFTENYSPELWSKQKKLVNCNTIVQVISETLHRISTYLSQFRHLFRRSALNFESAFTTVAVKEGSSEHVHIDRNDQGITWVLPIGEWEGGHMVIPQLGLKLPVRPGELLGFSANLLAHYSTPVTSGNRLVITMFTCRHIFSDSLLYSRLYDH
jgi:hypothetical protein